MDSCEANKKKKYFIELIKKTAREKAPPENVQYDYPDHPFIVGYRRPRNEVEWTVRQLNKAFNQTDNFQNPKWAWISGELSKNSISLLEKFVGQPWKKETSNIKNMVDLVTVADESITKRKFLGLLKAKLRRCCNIQNPDLLAWDEIFAAINDYLSVEQENTGTNAEQKDTMSKSARALAVLHDHPDWTNKQIADAIDANEKSLPRMKGFSKARKILKTGKSNYPNGSKYADPETRQGNLESWDNQ